MYDITLYLKPYVGSYLNTVIGDREGKIRIKTKELFSQAMATFLIEGQQEEIPERYLKGRQEIILSIPEEHKPYGDARVKHYFFPPDRYQSIEYFVDRQIDLELALRVNLRGDQKKKDVILNFLQFYGITESELTFETAKKRLDRERKRLKELRIKEKE